MRFRTVSRIVCLLTFGASFSLASCSSDSPSAVGAAGSATAAAGASASSGSGASDPNAIVGSFIAELFGPADDAEPYTAVSGKVYDGVTPPTVVWDPVSSEAGCQLLKPHAPFCADPCVNGAVCVADGKCAPYPVAQNLGPVRLKGLGSSDITLKPIANSYQLPGDVSLPYPPASEGAELSLDVSEGPFGAFSISTRMVSPLVSAGSLTLESGKALVLDWERPGNATLARMQIKVDISHHGGAKGKIECDVADSGSLQIPASLITALVDLGVAGFPSVTLSRVVTGSASIAPGKITFQALSSVTRELMIPGLQSCNADSDCAGKPCRQDKTCTP